MPTPIEINENIPYCKDGDKHCICSTCPNPCKKFLCQNCHNEKCQYTIIHMESDAGEYVPKNDKRFIQYGTKSCYKYKQEIDEREIQKIRLNCMMIMYDNSLWDIELQNK